MKQFIFIKMQFTKCKHIGFTKLVLLTFIGSQMIGWDSKKNIFQNINLRQRAAMCVCVRLNLLLLSFLDRNMHCHCTYFRLNVSGERWACSRARWFSLLLLSHFCLYFYETINCIFKWEMIYSYLFCVPFLSFAFIEQYVSALHS